jgi:exonuclease III
LASASGQRDSSGCAIAATISNKGTKIILISTYLPTGLDKFDVPRTWCDTDHSQQSLIQVEAHSIYEQVTEWIAGTPYWILGGDLNETRSELLDRKRFSGIPLEEKPKFVSQFLEVNNGIDLWRTLHPNKHGFTYRNDSCTSFSRLDYFVLSQPLFSFASKTDMQIGNWESKRDHARITLTLALPTSGYWDQSATARWSVSQPRLWNLTIDQRSSCKERAEESFKALEAEFKLALQQQTSLTLIDKFSQLVVQKAKDIVESVVGATRPTYRKGKFRSEDVVRATAEITTLQKARDLIRALFLKEYSSHDDKEEIHSH